MKSINSLSICLITESKSEKYQSNGPEKFLSPNLDSEHAVPQNQPNDRQLSYCSIFHLSSLFCQVPDV
jgi:hypothetical protein